MLWKVLQQNQAHQRGWREHGSHNGERTDAGKTVLNLFLLPLLQNWQGFQILECTRKVFFCVLIVLALGIFLQTVRYTVWFTAGKSVAPSLLPCPLSLFQHPYRKDAVSWKLLVWPLFCILTSKLPAWYDRNCIVTEPWALLSVLPLWQKRKQWIDCPLCNSCGRNATVCTCWKLIDVIARSWRTGLLSW